MRLALAQYDFPVGDIDGNVARIRAIMLRIALRNQPQLPRIRDQHLMAQRDQQATDPRRVRAHFQGDAHPPLPLEQDPQRRLRGL